MIEAALFDLGDTLFHFELGDPSAALEAAVRPLHEQLPKMGFNPPPLDRYLRVMNRRLLRAYLWSRVIRREVQLGTALCRAHGQLGINIDPGRMADLGDKCMIPAIRRFFTIDADGPAVIAQLHEANIKLGVVSNTILPRFGIDDTLQRRGLLDYLPVRVYSSEVRYMKPHRMIFQLALDQLGVPADRTVFIGDHVVNDVKGAARMGMRTVLIVHDGTAPRARVRPDHVIRRLSELPAVLGIQTP